jgi:hypothetical protein
MEVLREVEKVTGEKVPYLLAPRRVGDAASLVADSTRLRKALGWEPRRSSLHQIIKDSWEFHQRTAGATCSEGFNKKAHAACVVREPERATLESGMWKGSVIAVALILVSAVCALGCSSEICDLPAAPHESCHQHSQNAPHPSGHECFHKAATPQQAFSVAPVLDAILLPDAEIAAPLTFQSLSGVIPDILESPPTRLDLILRV